MTEQTPLGDSPFSITVLADRVEVVAGSGQATFTVTNRTPLRRSVFVSVEAEPNTEPEWFSLGSTDTLDLNPGEATQAIVRIGPAEIPSGRFSFRLRAVDEDDPDEFYAVSQSVLVEVDTPDGPTPKPKSELNWLPMFVGASAAGLVAFLVTLALTLLIATQASDWADGLGSLLLGIFAALVFFWLGGVGGAYLALRATDEPHRLMRTGAFTVLCIVLAPIVFGLVGLILPDIAAIAIFLLVMATLGIFAAAAFLATLIAERFAR